MMGLWSGRAPDIQNVPQFMLVLFHKIVKLALGDDTLVLLCTFENEVETGQGQGFSIYTSQNLIASQQDAAQVTFEPLPDILAKTVTATALRPRISCIDREKQRNSAKHITVYRPFPRSQLIYIKEIGLGWFGQVLLGDAEKIHVSSKKTRVVVKHLKDDASPSEQQLYLEEMAAYRKQRLDIRFQFLARLDEKVWRANAIPSASSLSFWSSLSVDKTLTWDISLEL
ncbi:hypothetical protein FSP39_016540 [Pinctada imbricata]|uniref:Serine-threonine/tyrosine-protein kinase catalytic domain-containing protein n=1 Tax=Pinctada imbricata TaxID=66713 RepID=A0AA88XZF5_PINIB|nr:hypothetical protein FSP39_016540 [Pinctada imbricata]